MLRVATVVPISDRRARLALILAVLGVPSLGITVPAAVWLGVGAVRQQRLSSGGEPAMGFIALVVSALDLFTINQVFVRSFHVVAPQLAWRGLAVATALALGVVVCTSFALRIHPERWGALLTARAGLVLSVVGGTGLFARLLTVIG